MRLKIELQLKSEQFPIDYRPTIISLFKHCLTQYDGGKHFGEYFDVGKSKSYTFAVGMPGSVFTKDMILVESKKVTITFSTSDMGTGILFFNAFMVQKNKSYPLAFENSMTLKNISVEREFVITTDKVNVMFMSPLCVREHNKQKNRDIYYSFEKEGFGNALLNVLKAQIEKSDLPISVLDGFSMEPIKCKKTVVRHHSQFIESTLGIFAITGNIALLNYLYANGVASRKSSGFGMIDVIREGII